MPLSVDSLCRGPDADGVLQRSARKWRGALERSQPLTHFPPSALNLKGALSRVPALPEQIPKDCDAIDGYSCWTNTGSSCPLRSKTERSRWITLRKRHCATCTLTEGGSFSTWEGNVNNGIALLVLGWAYVLSASLAEKQGLEMQYQKPPSNSASPGRLEIELPYATAQERTWWKAVLMPGMGWSISDGRITPWFVSMGDCQLEILGPTVDSSPPSADQAALYLGRFCDAFDLGGQISASLAAALTLRLHSSRNVFKPAVITLPAPTLASSRLPITSNCPADFKLIDHLMTLSLAPGLLVLPYGAYSGSRVCHASLRELGPARSCQC
jgi:hypothetical protein